MKYSIGNEYSMILNILLMQINLLLPFKCVTGKMLSRCIRTHSHVWLQLVLSDYSSVGLSSMIGHFRI